MASGIAYGRLATAESQYDPLLYMIDRYRKEAEKKESRPFPGAESSGKSGETGGKKTESKKDPS